MLTTKNIFDYARYMSLLLLSKGLSLSPLKLQKMLYYQQAWHMVFLGRENTLFEEVPQAWVNGPVYPSVYAKYKDTYMCDPLTEDDFLEEGKDTLTTMRELAERLNLSSDESFLTDRVITLYGSKSQDALVMMTHCEDPWCEKREGMLPYEPSQEELSLDTMYQFYKDRFEKNRKR